MTPSELLPWKFVIDLRTRSEWAGHLCQLKKIHGRLVAKKCIEEAIWIGSYPTPYARNSGRPINR